ncbi:unnamed protein product [Zymoseptoria tritici ST99CH_3D7]|uniref:Uncharacterized protein n=1 Tax=Zymoseptoria tritici (strain ST99CH_3D7) TaxID=1276538 RepID=A0A1X7RK64_ZYMT9|nr:unnamed protein product [Zymoseptoria tritici ST99CH_3D7]
MSSFASSCRSDERTSEYHRQSCRSSHRDPHDPAIRGAGVADSSSLLEPGQSGLITQLPGSVPFGYAIKKTAFPSFPRHDSSSIRTGPTFLSATAMGESSSHHGTPRELSPGK